MNDSTQMYDRQKKISWMYATLTTLKGRLFSLVTGLGNSKIKEIDVNMTFREKRTSNDDSISNYCRYEGILQEGKFYDWRNHEVDVQELRKRPYFQNVLVSTQPYICNRPHVYGDFIQNNNYYTSTFGTECNPEQSHIRPPVPGV